MKTYDFEGCKVRITEEAELYLNHNKTDIQQIANRLYVFAMANPFAGNYQVTLYLSRFYTGEAHLSIQFGRFDLPKDLIPVRPTLHVLREIASTNPNKTADSDTTTLIS